MSSEDENLLQGLRELRGGREVDVRERLNRLRTRIVRFAMRFVRNADLAEDIAQDVLVTAYNELDTFEGRSRFSTWVLGIARFRCMARMRRRSELLLEDEILDARADHTVVGAYALLRARERENVVLEAIAQLPELEKDALYMRYHLGLPVREIGDLLGVTEGTGARNLLQKSRRRFSGHLRRILDERGLTSSFLLVSSGWQEEDE